MREVKGRCATIPSMATFGFPRKPTLWIGGAAMAVLFVGIWILIHQWRTPPPEPASSAAEDTSDAVIEQALRQIPMPVDSAELKSRWVDEVKGVDVSALRPEQREIFVRFANAERCTCGCGYTLGACRTCDPTCPVSLPLVEKLRDSVLTGLIRSAEGIRSRPRGTGKS